MFACTTSVTGWKPIPLLCVPVFQQAHSACGARGRGTDKTIDDKKMKAERRQDANIFLSPIFLSSALLGLIALVFGGCQPAQQPAAPATTSGEAALSADELLRRMIQVYQTAESYSDHGLVRLRYRQAGQWLQDEGQLQVQLVRPNRLRVEAYQLTIVSDGRSLRAMIADRDSDNLDQQVLTRDAPGELPLETLYEDDVVRKVVAAGLGGPPVQLELLLLKSPLPYVFEPAAERQLLEPASVGDRDCYCVRVSLPEGPLVFWIDQRDYLLRRLEYPASRLAAQMSQASAAGDVSLTAEFRQARVNEPSDDQDFTLELARDAKPVKKFILPPPPVPSELLGRSPADFAFRDLQGGQVTRPSLLGHVAVLVWFNNHSASQDSLTRLSRIRSSLAGNSQVTFHAVCTEPLSLSDVQLRELVRRWEVDLPVVRDLQACGRDVFRIPLAPALVVLNERGVVQLFEVGAQPTQAETVPRLIQQLLDGVDVAAQVLEQLAADRRAYEQALSEARVSDPAESPTP
jgi:hypothetical protein